MPIRRRSVDAGYSKLPLQDNGSYPPSSPAPLSTSQPSRRPIIWFALGVFTLAVLSLASLHPRSLEQLKRLSRYTLARQQKTAVGPRSYQHLYQGCNLTELLLDLKESTIKDDAPSKAVNFSMEPYDPTNNAPPSFAGFSFDMNTCPPPHVFSQEEACDLIGGFGALLLSGDSFMRHVWDALLIFLTGDLSGAVYDPQHRAQCRGEAMFKDRQPDNWDVLSPCRTSIYDTLESLPEGVCPGRSVRGKRFVDLQWTSLNNILAYTSSLPAFAQELSPVLVFSGGLHLNLNVDIATTNFIHPVLDMNQRFSPHFVPIWQGAHAPGMAEGTPYYSSQGPAAVKNYMEGINKVMDQHKKLQTTAEGAVLRMEWYNATEGAESFDGQHYSYQVNTEKMFTLLTVLDLVWHEIEAAGGLVE